MRTKNAKRLWPVPATLGVMALAALLTFGLLATTGTQPAAAQDGGDCTFNVNADATGRTLSGITAADGTTVVSDAAPGSCFTTSEVATIAIKGPSVAPAADGKPITLHLLYEDDNGDLEYYPNGTFYQVDVSTVGTPSRPAGFYAGRTDDEDPAKITRYSSQTVEVPLAAVEGGKYVAQSIEVMLTGNFRIFDIESFNTENGFSTATECAEVGSNGVLESTGQYGECMDDDDVPGSPENLRADNEADAIVNVTFLGAPSLTQDDVGLGTDSDTTDSNNLGDKDPNGNSDTDPSSKLAAFDTMTPDDVPLLIEETASTIDPADFADQLWVQALGENDPVDEIPNAAATDSANRVFIIAEVRDANGQLLAGGSSVESAVMFDVMFHSDSDLKTVARTSYSDTKDVNSSGRAYIELTGWNTDSDPNEVGPVNVTVTASYIGPSGDLDLGEVELARVGASTELTVGTYMCVALGDDDKAKSDDGCPNPMADDTTTDEDETVEDTKPVMEMVFGRGEIIVVMAELMDMLGSETDDTPSISLSSDAKAALVPEDDATGALKRYMIKNDAELGMYTDGITVSYGRGDDKLEQKLTFTVSGEAENFELYMPAMYIGLATGTSETFTIMATDENGNVPSESSMVEVVVLGVESSYVSGLDPGNMLEVKDGSASFEIFTPVDAAQGDTALIIIRVDGQEVARHTFMFGDEDAAPGPPDPMERDEFTADYTVTATSTAGSGMVDVSWTRSEELSLSLVSLIQGDKVVDFTITGLTSTEFSGVDPGEYDVSVFSFRITEDGEKDGEIAFGTVTVE